ncbi:MAG: hypothetical protein R6U85_12935, partial [Salinivirgaceae bacterium]
NEVRARTVRSGLDWGPSSIGNQWQNYYKIAENYDQEMSSVVSCKNDRTYFAEPLFLLIGKTRWKTTLLLPKK